MSVNLVKSYDDGNGFKTYYGAIILAGYYWQFDVRYIVHFDRYSTEITIRELDNQSLINCHRIISIGIDNFKRDVNNHIKEFIGEDYFQKIRK
jgi:hypothetical protein